MRAELVLIQTDDDHRDALALIESLIGSDDPVDRLRLAAQAKLVEDYERSRWPAPTVEVAELLAYLMDQNNLSVDDLVPLVGPLDVVRDVMDGKASLTLAAVRRLRDRFGIPADLLIPPAEKLAA